MAYQACSIPDSSLEHKPPIMCIYFSLSKRSKFTSPLKPPIRTIKINTETIVFFIHSSFIIWGKKKINCCAEKVTQQPKPRKVFWCAIERKLVQNRLIDLHFEEAAESGIVGLIYHPFNCRQLDNFNSRGRASESRLQTAAKGCQSKPCSRLVPIKSCFVQPEACKSISLHPRVDWFVLCGNSVMVNCTKTNQCPLSPLVFLFCVLLKCSCWPLEKHNNGQLSKQMMLCCLSTSLLFSSLPFQHSTQLNSTQLTFCTCIINLSWKLNLKSLHCPRLAAFKVLLESSQVSRTKNDQKLEWQPEAVDKLLRNSIYYLQSLLHCSLTSVVIIIIIHIYCFLAQLYCENKLSCLWWPLF